MARDDDVDALLQGRYVEGTYQPKSSRCVVGGQLRL
jgi:hypothetical protein